MTEPTTKAARLGLAKLREIAEKALPGGSWSGEIVPQQYPESDDADLPFLVTDEQKRCVIYLPEAYGDRYRPYEADGEFVATFDPPTVLALIATMEALQEFGAQLREIADFLILQQDEPQPFFDMGARGHYWRDKCITAGQRLRDATKATKP